MAKLTPAQIEDSHGWLNDIFVCGGLLAKTKRPTDRQYWYMYGASSYYYYQDLIKNAKLICDEIKFRQFKDLDSALDFLANIQFIPNIKATRGQAVRKSADMLARYIANFCKEAQIYWDDSNRTPYEIEEWKKTILGRYLTEYGCLASQTNAPAKTSSGTRAASSGIPGQPKNDYKSTGPQSGNVRDLIGTAGNKEKLYGTIFCIVLDNANASKTEATAYVRPLNSDVKGASGSTNKVFVGSANAYTSCTIFFSDLAEADKVVQQIAARGLPNGLSNPHVARKNAKANGYYKVGTEFGPAYISASKLNEEVEIKEETVSLKGKDGKCNNCSYAPIQDIDTYDEAFYKYE